MNATEAAANFPLVGHAVCVVAVTGGHIHDTWRVESDGGTFVVQRLNGTVFPNLDAVTTNVVTFCEAAFPELTPLRSTTGAHLWRDEDDRAWRVQPALPRVSDPPVPPSAALVRQLGEALGGWHRRVASVRHLAVTVPRFHDLRSRLATLDSVETADPAGRRAAVADQIRRIHALARLVAFEVPEARVAHFDAKVENFLLDATTGAVRALVDLDTVMPGSIVWDVADLARSATATRAEDDPDTTFDLTRFAALAEGYVAATEGFLTSDERRALVPAAIAVTVEQAARFLTDHLAGDRYYRIARSDHNLDRARAQLALAEAMAAARSAMIAAV